MAEGTAYSAAQQLRSYGVGVILGLAAVGYVQAANTLMGPVMILLLGMGLVTTPEAARIAAPFAAAADPVLLPCQRGLGGWGTRLGGRARDRAAAGTRAVAARGLWRPTYPLAVPQTLFVLGNCCLTGAQAGLHALGAAKRSLRAMVIQSGIYLVLGILGAYLDGADRAVLGTAISSWIGAAVWWCAPTGRDAPARRQSSRTPTGHRPPWPPPVPGPASDAAGTAPGPLRFAPEPAGILRVCRMQETGPVELLLASCPNGPLQYPLCCSWAERAFVTCRVEPVHMAHVTGLSPLPWFQAKIDDGP